MLRVTYELEDGYVGKSRPHTVEIDDIELEEAETEEERQKIIEEIVEDDFKQNIFPVIQRVEEI